MTCHLKLHFFDEIATVLGRSRDPASSLTKFALMGYPSFGTASRFIRDNVDISYDKYRVKFRLNGKNVDLKKQIPFFAKRVYKFVLLFPLVEWHVDHVEEPKLDCEAMKILNDNHVIDTIEIAKEYRDIPKFLVALLHRWPNVKTLHCRSKLLIDAMYDDATILLKLETLGLRWDFKDLCNILKVCHLSPTLKHIEVFPADCAKALVHNVFPPIPSVTSVRLLLDVDAISGSYFDTLTSFLKCFPNLEYAEVNIHNDKLTPKEHLIPKVDDLSTKFKEFDFGFVLRFRLIEDYDVGNKVDLNANQEDEDDGSDDEELDEDYDEEDPYFDDSDLEYQLAGLDLLSSLLHTLHHHVTDAAPDDLAAQLSDKGFEEVTKTTYRRIWKYPGKTFTHEVCFKNESEFSSTNHMRHIRGEFF